MKDYFQQKNSYRYDQSQFIDDGVSSQDEPQADEAAKVDQPSVSTVA